jgi:hypothetical protein
MDVMGKETLDQVVLHHCTDHHDDVRRRVSPC